MRDIGPMAHFLVEGLQAEETGSEGPHHQFQIGDEEGYGRMLEL